MNSKTISIHLTASILIIVAFESCQRSTTINQPEQSLTIVSHDLPAYEIMKMQGITSLHYVLYDSSAKGSPLDSSFYPLDEYFIDSNHVESIEYFGNNHYGYVSVFDLRKNVAWYYLNGQVTYMDSLNLPAAVEQGIQSSLGSFLKVPATYLG